MCEARAQGCHGWHWGHLPGPEQQQQEGKAKHLGGQQLDDSPCDIFAALQLRALNQLDLELPKGKHLLCSEGVGAGGRGRSASAPGLPHSNSYHSCMSWPPLQMTRDPPGHKPPLPPAPRPLPQSCLHGPADSPEKAGRAQEAGPRLQGPRTCGEGEILGALLYPVLIHPGEPHALVTRLPYLPYADRRTFHFFCKELYYSRPSQPNRRQRHSPHWFVVIVLYPAQNCQHWQPFSFPRQ